MLSTRNQRVVKLYGLIVVGAFVIAMGLFFRVLWEYGPAESFVVPPGMKANEARLHLYMSVQHNDQQHWQDAKWHIHELSCTTSGIAVNTMNLELPTVAAAQFVHLSLMFPEAMKPHAAGLAAYMDDPDAVSIRLLFREALSTTYYRLIESHLVLSPDRQDGMLEAFLEDETGKMLFVDAHWACDGITHPLDTPMDV